MKGERKKIDCLKGIIFPLFTMALIVLFILNDKLTPFIGPQQNLSAYSSTELQLIQILFGVCTLLLLVGTEVARKSLSRGSFEVQSIPFITALRNREWYALLIQYPLTLLFEELLFRGLFYALLLPSLPIMPLILLNAVIFGFYHIHVFLTSKNWKISAIFMIFSLCLALPLGYVILYFGVIGCWVFHLVLVTYIYLRWNSIKSP